MQLICPRCGFAVKPLPAEMVRMPPFALRVETGEVSLAGRLIAKLSPTQSRVLTALMEAAGKVCTKDDLMTINGQWDCTTAVLTQEVFQIRRKLRGYGINLLTIRGIGYRLEIEQ